MVFQTIDHDITKDLTVQCMTVCECALRRKNSIIFAGSANNSLSVSLATTVKTSLNGTESRRAKPIFDVPQTEV